PAATLDRGFKVPQPMHPADLPTTGGLPGVGTPAICHQDATAPVPGRSCATLAPRDRRTAKTVPQVVTAPPTRHACVLRAIPSRPSGRRVARGHKPGYQASVSPAPARWLAPAAESSPDS